VKLSGGDSLPGSAATGPKFSSHVGAGFGAQPDTCGRRSTCARDGNLGNGAGGGMSGDTSSSGRSFARLRIAGDHRTDQRVLHAGAKATLGRTVVVQVLVQGTGNGMLDGGFHCVCGKSGPNVFAEACGPAAMAQCLDACPRYHAGNWTLANYRLFPVLSVRMTARGDYCGRHAHGTQHPREYHCGTHTHTDAIGWPNQAKGCIVHCRRAKFTRNKEGALRVCFLIH
jgi:hypothetical protein